MAQLFGLASPPGTAILGLDLLETTLNFCADYQEEIKKLPNNDSDDISRKIYLTSLIIIALQKNSIVVKKSPNKYKYENVIKAGIDFIENQHNFNNKAAAIAAYATAISNRSDITNHIINSLNSQSKGDGKKKYWNLDANKNTSVSDQTIITAYTAMALIEIGRHIEAHTLIRWILEHSGVYQIKEPTLSIAVALEAISMMSLKTPRKNTNIQFEFISSNNNWKKNYNLTNLNRAAELIEGPKGTLNVTIIAQGYGYGLVQTYHEYYKIIDEVSRYFTLQVFPDLSTQSINIEVTRLKSEPSNSDLDNNVIMEISLNSGYIYDAEMSKPMEQNSNIWVN